MDIKQDLTYITLSCIYSKINDSIFKLMVTTGSGILLINRVSCNISPLVGSGPLISIHMRLADRLQIL